MDTTKVITLPPQPVKKVPSDLQTTTTTTVDGDKKDPLFVPALMVIIIYGIVGIVIGIVVVWSLSFPLQLVAMGSYLALGVCGWLPWQISRGK